MKMNEYVDWSAKYKVVMHLATSLTLKVYGEVRMVDLEMFLIVVCSFSIGICDCWKRDQYSPQHP